MSDKTIIGFMGLAGAGKTTAAQALQAAAKTSLPIVYSFAGPLKEAVKRLCLFSDEQVYGDLDAKSLVDPRWGFSPRQALQMIGTDCVRKMLCEDFWVRRMRLAVEQNNSSVIIIDDVRFEDEANFIREFNGHVVMIRRPGGPVLPWHASENPPEHTATMLTINNRSKEEFEKAVVATFSKLYPNLFSTGGEE